MMLFRVHYFDKPSEYVRGDCAIDVFDKACDRGRVMMVVRVTDL